MAEIDNIIQERVLNSSWDIKDTTPTMTDDQKPLTVSMVSNNGSNLTFPGGCVVLQDSDFLSWDNSDSLVSRETMEMFDKVLNIGFVNLFYMISAPTNIVNMVVFAKQGLKERINLCLFFQSLADLAYMTAYFSLYIDQIYLEIKDAPTLSLMVKFFVDNYLFTFAGFRWVSGFMTVVIACERCVCVLFPLRSKRILQTRSMLVIIIVASVLLVGLFSVVVAKWDMVCIYDIRTDTKVFHVSLSKFYLHNKKVTDALHVYVYGSTLPWTFTFAVTVFTVITVIKLRKMASWREKTSSAGLSSREVALTRMLIGSSTLFIICSIPVMVFWSYPWLVPDVTPNGRKRYTFQFLTTLMELFDYINFSVNFFIYYTVGTKYRETLKSMCCWTKI